MQKLADQDDFSRRRFRLALVAVVILAIALMVAIVYGSIRRALGPVLARYYYSRGYALAMKRNYDRALADFSEAIRLDPKYSDAYFRHGSLAWFWTFCPDQDFRDARSTVESATTACELSGWREAQFLETLAAAYSASGDFAAAAKWQTKANEHSASPQVRTAGEARLSHYLRMQSEMDIPQVP